MTDEVQKLKEPVTVSGVIFTGDANPISPDRLFGAKPGAFVSVRPVSNNEEGKTYLGIMLGDYASPSIGIRKEENGENTIVVTKSLGTPAMWVPDLNRVVMGWGSWWSEIKTPEDLRQITDHDIENVWYVKALRTAEGWKTDPQPTAQPVG